MIAFISILITICLFFFFIYWQKKQKAKGISDAPSDSSEHEVLPYNNNSMDEVSKLKTKELCLDALKSLNCQVSFDEGMPDSLLFYYQGENFIIDASNECCLITIWDQFWYDVDLDNLEEVSRVRKAINSVNINTTPTMVYTFVGDTNKMWVHTKMTALFDEDVHDRQNYLRALFSMFFDVHRLLLAEIDRLKKAEC